MGAVVELIRRPVESELSASAALLALREDDRPVALVGAWAGGGAIVASDPVRVARAEEDPLALLDDLPAVRGDGDAVGGGWLGFLGYRVGNRVERLAPAPPQPVPVRSFALAYYDHVLRRDREGRWWFEALWSDEHAERLERRLALLAGRLAGPAPAPRPHRCGPF